jgi:hypothetical protein
VTSGSGSDSQKSEIIDLDDATNECKPFPDSPFDNAELVSAGLLDDNTILMCGGTKSQHCYIMTSERVTQSAKAILPDVIAGSVSVMLSNNTLWITGGLRNSNLTDTEYVSPDGTMSGPIMPVSNRWHCIVAVNSSTVLLTGGYDDSAGKKAIQTHYYNYVKNEWITGASLKQGRSGHACGQFRHENDDIIIISGGNNENGTINSTEFLVVGTNSWVNGKLTLVQQRCN